MASLRLGAVILVLFAALAASSCSRDDTDAAGEVVVYCALDENFSEPIARAFEEKTGIRVRLQTDLEKTKTVGLVRAIEEEAARPRCDVFWNNEIVHTLRLKEQGLLEPYHSPSAAGLPDHLRDPEGYWHGFAARGRVFIVNTDLLPSPADWPRKLDDLVDPRFKGKATIAKPLTGTTQTHAGVLYATRGKAATEAFFQGLFDNEVALTSGNAHVMRMVRNGDAAFGLTDTDDFNVARVENFSVDVVYPDQGDGESGTLLIPNTIAIIKGAPHRAAAEKFIDYVLSPEVEERLAFSDSAQIPVRSGVKRPPHVIGPPELKVQAVDFEAAAKAVDEHLDDLERTFVK